MKKAHAKQLISSVFKSRVLGHRSNKKQATEEMAESHHFTWYILFDLSTQSLTKKEKTAKRMYVLPLQNQYIRVKYAQSVL